jgi:membrane associated rhomboid family serine protease
MSNLLTQDNDRPTDGQGRPWSDDGVQDQIQVLGEDLSWEETDAQALVLASAQINYRFRKSGWGWSLEVAAAEADRAKAEIERFYRENPPGQESVALQPIASSRTITGIVVALMLLAFHAATTRHGAHEMFILQAGASAEHILHGEYWRAITALTLHSDVQHLAGNMLAIAIFGTLLCKQIGYGAAWLLIVLAGAGGNLLNAWLHQSQHLSIGASTAVFGAVGLLGGIRLLAGLREAVRGVATWWSIVRAWVLPLGAALGLLAILGSGGQTDLGAHLFGCLSGLLLGCLYALRFPFLVEEGRQRLFLLAALAIVGGSWWSVRTLF